VSTNAQMSAVPHELSGHASSLTNWAHQMINALTVALAGSVAELRIAQVSAEKGIAFAYTSTTNMMMLVSCVLLMLMIPIALKFYRNKNEC
ncbi:MAG: hypothetical protein J6A39_08070, partial [Peptococcaceae bacterium]|nr:hypothetical protein [Peptococcaceae bacterium]